MMETAKVLVNVVTGFLGAGKTTLVVNLLREQVRGERVAVIVNELGEIGIDGRIIERTDYRVKELTSGCICCEISANLRESVEEIIDQYHPDRLLLEATGIAEPTRILSTFFSYESLVRTTSVEPTICVVDCSGFQRLVKALTFQYVCQLKAAELVLLNKVDLVDLRTVQAVRREIGTINPRAWVMESERCRVPLDFLFLGTIDATLREAAAAQAERVHPHGEDFTCFSYVRSQVRLSRERLERVLRRMPRDLFRLKGFVRLDDGPYLLNYVTGHYELEPAPEAEDVRLVFIGRKLRKERLLAQLERCRIQDPPGPRP